MTRIALFLATNIAVLVVVSIIFNLGSVEIQVGYAGRATCGLTE
jgi:hypothetical protein